MSVPAVLHGLIRSCVEFETDGECVRWRNGKGRITPAVIDMLRTKAEIIRDLSAAPEPSRGLAPHVAAAVQATFADYVATDHPYDERAWQCPQRPCLRQGLSRSALRR